jgi:hypothetical protein
MRPAIAPATAVAALLAAAGAALAIPPYTTTIVHGNGDFIQDFGVIGGSFSQGFVDYNIRNDGTWLMEIRAGFGSFPHALIASDSPNHAYLIQDRGEDDVASGTGFLTAPTSDHVVTAFHRVEVSSDGREALVLSVGPAEFTSVDETSGVFLSRDLMLIEEGDLVTAPGLAAGTTWAPFTANSQVKINASGQILLISAIIESGAEKLAAVVVSFDAAGAITGETLVAKVGGPVGGGPDTWTELSTSTHASALNNAGEAIISGRTAAGVTGLYLNGAMVARTGDPTPDPSYIYGDLFGAPVDLNNGGHFVFRAPTSNPEGVWAEKDDAGEDAIVRLEHDITRGDGPLTKITGRLTDDLDVDLYSIFVDDPAAFSATTVPGGGSAGAAFDTVLYLFRGGGTTPGPVLRNDDAAAGVPQSTITGAALADFNPDPREYVLAVATRRPAPEAFAFTVLHPNVVSGDTVQGRLWEAAPADVEVHEGVVYWVDHGTGVIKRRTTAGAPLADIPVGTGALADIAILDDPAGDKIYFYDSDEEDISRCNLDGSSLEDVYTPENFPTGPSAGAVWGLAAYADMTGGKVYWTRGIHGEINRANLDGTLPELVLESTLAAPADRQFAISRIAIDPVAGKLYWIAERDRRITRSNLDGTGLENIISNVDAADIALDAAGGKIYFTDPTAGLIRRANLNGTGLETVITGGEPTGIALAPAAGMLYWTDPASRLLRRSSIAAPAAQTFFALPADTAQRRGDGILQDSALGFWERSGAPTGGELPYEIALTGASFAEGTSMVVRDNVAKVAATFDSPPPIAPNVFAEVGAPESPVHISDAGDIIYYAQWDEPTFSNSGFDGLFYNQEVLVRRVDSFEDPEPLPPAELGLPGNVIFIANGANGFDFSDSGEYLLARINHFTGYPLTPFAQEDSIVLFQFDQVAPSCPCELTGDAPASVNVFDLLAYLDLWFAGAPGADIDATPGVNVFDLLAYLDCWFPASAGAPCP